MVHVRRLVWTPVKRCMRTALNAWAGMGCCWVRRVEPACDEAPGRTAKKSGKAYTPVGADMRACVHAACRVRRI